MQDGQHSDDSALSCYISHFFKQSSSGVFSWFLQDQESKSQCTRIFLTSGCVMFDNIPVANASAVVEPRVKEWGRMPWLMGRVKDWSHQCNQSNTHLYSFTLLIAFLGMTYHNLPTHFTIYGSSIDSNSFFFVITINAAIKIYVHTALCIGMNIIKILNI